MPSLVIGYMTIGPMLFGDYFGAAIHVADSHAAMRELAYHFDGATHMALHALGTLPFWLALAGVGTAWFFYMKRQDIPATIQQKFSVIHTILENKYGFDQFNDWFFAGGARKLGAGLWKRGDQTVIDGWVVNGAARMVGFVSGMIRHVQSGYIYHYAFAMIIGVFVLVTWFVKATA